MPGSAETFLVLGGTAEANKLVAALRAVRPDARIILSLAGRTTTPVLPADCAIRVGGFGGSDGLAAYLSQEAVTCLLDATHPFAAGISRNAARAADAAGIRRLALVRPPWVAEACDRWTSVACLAGARDALPANARPFLALGRQHLAPFAARPDLRPVVRMIEEPEPPLPFAAEIVLARPSADVADEAALLARLAVTHLVCRNSGGGASFAKIAAARELGLPVIMIDRPPEPAPPVVRTVEEMIAAIAP
ncbi:MAG: cobalt-precorrin-6A reductase [Aurantimonas endophytica]|uniref:cobalt-precorrin-6A reductase n=1 Tax=Aurantimonas endophytica TaxID=1522175 RepID=UPI0030012A91